MSAARIDVDLADLLARAGAGDLEAFMAFYDATSGLVYHLESCRRGHLVTAEDATVERYVAAWLRAAEHAGSGLSPRAWLLSLRVESRRDPGPAGPTGTRSAEQQLAGAAHVGVGVVG